MRRRVSASVPVVGNMVHRVGNIAEDKTTMYHAAAGETDVHLVKRSVEQPTM
jgi:hypothetical protein